jgi:protein TonB
MRFPRWIFPAGGIALCVNGVLLCTALFLSHEKIEQKQDIEGMTQVNYLPEMSAEEPQQEQPVSEPEKPKEEPQPDLGPDLFEADIAPELAALGAAAGAVSINLGGATQGISKENFVFESYELDQTARPMVKTPPVYPYKARQDGVEGVVQVKIKVLQDGSVGEVLIVDSRPKDVFDDAVLAAVPRWRFEPGKVGGKPVTSWVVTALHFKLNS